MSPPSSPPQNRKAPPLPRRDSSEMGGFDHRLSEQEKEIATNIVRNLMSQKDRSKNFSERAGRRADQEQMRQKLADENNRNEGAPDENEFQKWEEAMRATNDGFQKIENSADGKELNRDARVIEEFGKMVLKKAQEAASMRAKKFKMSTFARKVKLFAVDQLRKEEKWQQDGADNIHPALCLNDDDILRTEFGEDDDEEEYPNDYNGLKRAEWACLGRKVGGFLHKGPQLSYIAPVISAAAQPVEKKVKKERQATQRSVKAEQVVLKIKQEEEHAADEMAVSKELDVVRKALRKALRRNDNVVGYYNFVMDPDDFAKTVENIFHTSFLIKDGLARLALNDDGLPTLYGLDEEQRQRMAAAAASGDGTLQAILPFDMFLWKEMISALDVTDPMIPSRTEPVV